MDNFQLKEWLQRFLGRRDQTIVVDGNECKVTHYDEGCGWVAFPELNLRIGDDLIIQGKETVEIRRCTVTLDGYDVLLSNGVRITGARI
jgi:hypothetical protein